MTEEDRETAIQLLIQLIDIFPDKDTIIWERAWIDNMKIHRTRYRITIDVEQID